MSAGLEPYPEMKDSGVEWLGKVPAHWDVRRGKQIFRCIDVRSDTGQEELLTVSSNHGVVPRQSVNVTMFKAESYVGYKLCWPNDLVINSLWAWARGLGISEHHGIISSAYGVYRPNQSVEPKFIHLLVRSIPFQWELRVLSKGIWISRLQLTDDSFLCASLPLPPLDEQTAIARYLDHMDRRIRDYIRAKEKLIALLDEYKQALISEAVTGRTDVRTGEPYPEYKDSGVEWLGKVPAHWEVRRLKRICRLAYGDSLPNEMRRRGEFLVYGSNGSIGSHQSANTMAPCIVVGRKGSFGKVNFSPKPVFAIDTTFFIDRRFTSTDIRWLHYVLSWIRLDAITKDSAIPGLDREDAYQRYAPLPPLPEQSAIAEYLDEAAAAVDAATARARRQIDLLGEYRTRLIADAVTGKLDVRGAAAALPDPAPALDEATAAP